MDMGGEEMMSVVVHGEAVRQQRKQSVWPFVVLVSVNSLSVPAMLAAVLIADLGSQPNRYEIFYGYVIPFIAAIMYSQLIGLAFWMSFGSWPTRWRSLLIFSITVFLGLILGLGVGVIDRWNHWESRESSRAMEIFVIALGVPIFAAALVWMANAIYVIPAWYFGYEIGLRDRVTTSRRQNRTFGVAQMLSWTAQCAIPLGMLKAISFLGSDGEKVTELIAPSLLLFCCCTPLMVFMLKSRFSSVLLAAAWAWFFLVGVIWGYFADGIKAEILPAWCIVVACFTMTANMLALRWLNLQWRPKVEQPGRA